MEKPALWVDGKQVEYDVIRTPVYPRSRLKRLWWRLRGISPTQFSEYVELNNAPSVGAHVIMYETEF